MGDLGILDLLGLTGFRPSSEDRIVRHQEYIYPASDLLRLGLLEAYQSYQGRARFRGAKHIVSTYGLDGARACFVGVYENLGECSSTELPPITASAWEQEWRQKCKYRYELKRMKGFEHLEHRVVLDWGPGALSWCQRLRNKSVIEITAPGRVLPPFRDYLEFELTYGQLVELFAGEDAHREWRSRLSAVAGIYLILAETTGDLYVGSATGAEGVWGRWRQYAKTRHGGNRKLAALTESDPAYPSSFRFSLLQILPKTISREDILEHESQFKAKLGCRAHGLNLN